MLYAIFGECIAGPGMIPPHVDTILVKNYYEFFSENLGIDSTRDRYRESFFSSAFAFYHPEKKVFKKKCKLYVQMVKYTYA